MSQIRNFNPFNFLCEHQKRPFSRFFRTTLWRKCTDTFWVFLGRLQRNFEIDTLGLTDYLSLGLFLGLHQFFLYSYKNYKKDFRSFALFLPSLFINAFAWLFKVFVSVVLTVLFFPIIVTFHALSFILGGSYLHSQVLSLKGIDKSTKHCLPSTCVLSDFLSHHNHSLADLKVKFEIHSCKLSSQLIKTTEIVGNNLTSLFFQNKKLKTKAVPEINAKLIFSYKYEEEKKCLSNTSFVYLSALLLSIFPFLALLSAKSITLSASERISKALKADTVDRFEVNVDHFLDPQRDEISALFKLNVSSLLEELYADEEVTPSLITSFINN